MSDQKNQTFVIVGAALAGASAAKALREEGFTGRVLVVGAESHPPYIRPPLSKGYLSGADERSSVFVEADDWYEKNDVELQLGTRVVSIDPATHSVVLGTGETVAYDKLLLTTGSSPRLLSIAGSDLAGVHYLRTIEDSERLHAALEQGGKRLVLIGSGWIGMEVAATAHELGNEVVVLERGEIPLAKALGDELGQFFAELHKEKGVDIRPLTEIAAIVGSDGAVTGVSLKGGEVVPADLVLAAIGAVPNVGLAESAGMAVDNGILVDAAMQTSIPDIYAAGDVANTFHPVIQQRLRSEHWANARDTGPAAAKAMLGQTVEFAEIPYFYTDQFDVGMEFSGYGPLLDGATVVYRGNKDGREFIAFLLDRESKVVAGMNVNVWDVNEAVQGIIRRGNVVDPAKLADESVALDSL
jgi:NADPH-dependent 2,4-dienoyl-CoA reductase/sulfur reductase-like enzyme